MLGFHSPLKSLCSVFFLSLSFFRTKFLIRFNDHLNAIFFLCEVLNTQHWGPYHFNTTNDRKFIQFILQKLFPVNWTNQKSKLEHFVVANLSIFFDSKSMWLLRCWMLYRFARSYRLIDKIKCQQKDAIIFDGVTHVTMYRCYQLFFITQYCTVYFDFVSVRVCRLRRWWWWWWCWFSVRWALMHGIMILIMNGVTWRPCGFELRNAYSYSTKLTYRFIHTATTTTTKKCERIQCNYSYPASF